MNINSPKINCTKCGECCKGFSKEKSVVLFPHDIATISSNLGLTQEDFCKKYCKLDILETEIKNIELYTLQYTMGECIFLDNNLCSIFEYKPIQCQRAPFNFFWSGSVDYSYECLKGISIPDDMSSSKSDQELVKSLFNNTN